MDILAIGEGVDLTTPAAGNWVSLSGTPFIEGRSFLAEIGLSPDATGAGVIAIEGSNDGGTTVDTLLTVNGLDALKKAKVAGYKQVRVNVTTGYTAGTANAYGVGGV